jgi:hypothetical protein
VQPFWEIFNVNNDRGLFVNFSSVLDFFHYACGLSSVNRQYLLSLAAIFC